MARKLVQDKLQELASGKSKLSRQIKNQKILADVVVIWVDEPKFKNLAISSQERYLNVINNHLLPKMGHKIMADIDRETWLAFFRKMQEQKYHISGKVIKGEAIRAWQNHVVAFIPLP